MNRVSIKTYLLLLTKLALFVHINAKNLIPEDYQDEGLTPEKIASQLGIPIAPFTAKKSVPKVNDFQRTPRPNVFPKIKYTAGHLLENDEDAFETIPTQPSTKSHSTIQVDNEVKIIKTTTPKPFLVDEEVRNDKTTTPKPFIVDEEVKTAASTVSSKPFLIDSEVSTQISSTTTTQSKEHNFIVDGEAHVSTQFTPRPEFKTQLTSGTFETFNPWALFTTFPPDPFTTTIQSILADYSPNCLANSMLCEEGGNYEKFMRTYCPKTCQIYENSVLTHKRDNECTDLVENCSTLKEHCLVQHSPYYLVLKRNCRQTCQLCESTNQVVPISSTLIPTAQVPLAESCRDIGQNCASLISGCKEPSTAAMLGRYCAKTCNLCSSCKDELEFQCGIWVSKGFCQSQVFRPAIKRKYCQKSCNLCDPAPSVFPDFG